MSLSNVRGRADTTPTTVIQPNAETGEPGKLQVKHPAFSSAPRQLVGATSTWSTSIKPFPFTGFPVKFSPGVAVHDDKLCVLWQPQNEHLFLSVMDTDETWSGAYHFWDTTGAKTAVMTDCIAPPALAEVGDVLHAVFVENGNKIVHYICDDSNGIMSSTWSQQPFVHGDNHTVAAPAITSLGRVLYLAFRDSSANQVFWAQWTVEDGWSAAEGISTTTNGNVTKEYTWGSPGILVLDDQLHIVFSNAVNRDMIEIVYDGKIWSRAAHPPGEYTAGGLSCSSYTNKGLLTFPANEPNNNDTPVLVCIWQHGSWSTSSGDGNTGQSTCDTPVVAELSEKAYVLWVPTDGSRILCLTSRRLDYDFIQDSWMKYTYSADSHDSLTSLVIPGTHDSCAAGGGALIATQNLSIVEQLKAGIRFFDFRVGFNLRKIVVMYHGIFILYDGLEEIFFDQDVLAHVRSWLDLNNETIVVSVKHEIFGDEDNVFAAVNTIFQGYADYIYTGSTGFPTLAEPLKWPHGKMVVILRTDDTSCKFGFPLPPSEWPDDMEYFTIPKSPAGSFFIQDFWNISAFPYVKGRDSKLDVIKKAMSIASVNNFICFTSATGGKSGDLTQGPENLATGYLGDDGINDIMLRTGWTKKVPGIYPMDFPDNPSDLIPTMIALNFPGNN